MLFGGCVGAGPAELGGSVGGGRVVGPPPLGGVGGGVYGDGVALGVCPGGIPLPLSDGVCGGWATSEALSDEG